MNNQNGTVRHSEHIYLLETLEGQRILDNLTPMQVSEEQYIWTTLAAFNTAEHAMSGIARDFKDTQFDWQLIDDPDNHNPELRWVAVNEMGAFRVAQVKLRGNPTNDN